MRMKRNYGFLLVMLAAGLWAVDALLRTNLTETLTSSSIVLYEHIVGFIILSPFFFKALKKYKALTAKDWGLLLLMTIVSSVAGTLLFTEALNRSFAVFDFATPILLQKLQPIFVIVLAWLFLRETLSLRFIALVITALIGSYLISFGADPVPLGFEGKAAIVWLAIGAALCWGSGTVMSKQVLTKLSFQDATALRFLLAIPIALIVAFATTDVFGPVNELTELTGNHIWRLVVIAFTTGAGAILIYYKGLQMTPAKVTTMAELTFPIVSILIAITTLNPFGEPQILSLANVFGIIVLLISILIISFDYGSKKET